MTRSYAEGQPQKTGMYKCTATRTAHFRVGEEYWISRNTTGFLAVQLDSEGAYVDALLGKWEKVA